MEGDGSYLKADQDLLGGIETGVSRGQSLKEAMLSLYNAGYEKVDIEKAARAYLELSNMNERLIIQTTKIESKNILPKKTKEELEKEKLDNQDLSKKESPQVVSSYLTQEEKDKKKDKKSDFKFGANKPKEVDIMTKNQIRGKVATYLLIAILFFLLAALATVFLFKDELVRFINNLFG